VNVSPLGRKWTAHCEGCSLTAYPDNGACSIGYGHRGVPEGTEWTRQQAEDALDDDLAGAAYAIGLQVKVDLTQGQFDALADFVFNLGSRALAESTLLRVLNFGEYGRVPDELRRWKFANGAVSPGLVARREGEIVLWNGRNPLEGR
jgi:lysozyme